VSLAIMPTDGSSDTAPLYSFKLGLNWLAYSGTSSPTITPPTMSPTSATPTAAPTTAVPTRAPTSKEFEIIFGRVKCIFCSYLH
jgi:hypothetical protein